MEYTYLGDRYKAESLKQMGCNAVRRNGKCICGKNGPVLVCFKRAGK